MATTSYFSISFTEDEKGMIRKILQLPFNQYQYLGNELDALLDISRMCEKHQLPYQFYDDNQFYCPTCLTMIQPRSYHYIGNIKQDPIEENERQSILNLSQSLAKYEKSDIPNIDFEERAKAITKAITNQNQSLIESNVRLQQTNEFQTIQQLDSVWKQDLRELLEKRTKYLEVQKFISHISIEQNNRKIHDEMHNVDSQMRPKDNFSRQNIDNSRFESIVQQIFRTQI